MSLLFDELETDIDPSKDNEFIDMLRPDTSMYGKYRIEITFEFRRSSIKNSPCFIGVYRSNKSPDLNMDFPLFFCSGERDEDGCGSILTNDDMLATLESGQMMKVVFCDKCGKYINKQLTASHLFFNNTKKSIAERVYKLFCELNRDADIVLVYTNKDIKKANESKYGEDLNKVRDREVSIYPLANLIKDVSAGESEVKRKIEDFISV